MRLLVLSEGVLDIGDETATSLGAVRVLTQRMLEENGIQVEALEVDRLARMRGNRRGVPHGYDAKVRRGIEEARMKGFTAVAVVIDRDRDHGERRLRLLQKGREDALQAPADHAVAERTALGVAIECVEAWLLADEKAIASTCPTQKDPESHFSGAPGSAAHPKNALRSLLGDSVESWSSEYDRIASAASLQTIEKRCSRSFKPFADEIRRIAKVAS